MALSDLDVLIVNLITASREAGFCRGKNAEDADANGREFAALKELKDALDVPKPSVIQVTECRECGSTNLTWHCGQKNLAGVTDGRLRLHDVGTEFFLGCDDCSETLRVVSGDKVAEILTSSM